MPINGWLGLPRMGKTLDMVRTSFLWHKEDKRVVRANFNLTFGERINIMELIDFELENCILLLDEIQTFLDSRSSGEAETILDYFFMQSGKRDVDILWSAQLLRSVDVRLRELTSTYRQAWKTKRGFVYKVYLFGEFQGFDLVTFKEAKKYYNLYDTKEVIMPIRLTHQNNLTMIEISEIFDNCPNMTSFKVMLRSKSPYITIDKAEAIYVLLKNDKKDMVKKLLRLK